MVGGRQTAIRFTDQDEALLAALQARLGLNVTDVVRLAIRRMADMEGIRPEPTQGFTEAELVVLRALITPEGLAGAWSALAAAGVHRPHSQQIVDEATRKLLVATGIDQGPGHMVAGPPVRYGLPPIRANYGLPPPSVEQLRAVNEAADQARASSGPPKQRNHMQETIDRVTGANKRKGLKK
jgi:hypothetical protein